MWNGSRPYHVSFGITLTTHRRSKMVTIWPRSWYSITSWISVSLGDGDGTGMPCASNGPRMLRRYKSAEPLPTSKSSGSNCTWLQPCGSCNRSWTYAVSRHVRCHAYRAPSMFDANGSHPKSRAGTCSAVGSSNRGSEHVSTAHFWPSACKYHAAGTTFDLTPSRCNQYDFITPSP